LVGREKEAVPGVEANMRTIGLPEIIAICGVLTLFGFALVLLVGALRWKQSRSVQRALIDKLASGNDLGTFLQSPAGDKFMRGIANGESTARSIITSIQRGIVVLVVGLGTSMLGDSVPFTIRIIGFLLVSLGAGLLIAAFVSSRVARRWQLLGQDSVTRDK
jgi:hypothetical protein